MAIPTKRFSHVHIDLVGPLPVSAEGFTHLLTAMDRSTQWAEALPLKATAAADCVDAFVTSWVARFSIPDAITLDRRAQFTSAVWAARMSRLGVAHKLTTSFHPQSNSAVKGFTAASRIHSGHGWPDLIGRCTYLG
jgi:Integrase core domain